MASIPAIKAAPASKLVLRAKVLTNKSGQDLGVPMGPSRVSHPETRRTALA